MVLVENWTVTGHMLTLIPRIVVVMMRQHVTTTSRLPYLLLLPQTGVGHFNEVDIEQLPEAIPRGNFHSVKLGNGEPTIVCLDLETTDLIRGTFISHIKQIAATEIKYVDSFFCLFEATISYCFRSTKNNWNVF